MSMSSRGGAATLRGFRLSDVPEPVRQAAVDRILRSADAPQKLADRIALGVAAMRPSDRIYFVREQAWEREARKRLWKSCAQR